MKSVETLEKTTFSGRRFTRKQLAQVQETVEIFQNLSLRELANTVCEHLDWKNAKGSYKVQSCLTLLDELQARDIVKLPTKVKSRAPVRSVLEPKEPETSIDADLDAISPISLEPVTSAADRKLWARYVQSYHYLGYKRPVGSYLCYFIVSEARQQKLGCMLFSASASWALAPRDKWIGWQKKHKQKLLNLILVQNRFLIFPWVKVPNLATRILSLATKQVGDDWVRVHGYRPVLIETFVDTTKYSGASYRAGNWQYLGETQGRGYDPKHEQKKSRKSIFVYPLQSDWRRCLTEGHQTKSLKKRYRNDLRSSHSRNVGDSFVKLWERVIDILHQVAEEYDDKWQVRKRVLNSLLLMLLIFRLVSSKDSKSYGTTIDELWNSCKKLNIPLPQKSSVAPSSFCTARRKLDETIFKSANQRIIEAYAPEVDGRYTWLGHRLFAIDGSKINLPRKFLEYGYRTPSNNAHYPKGLLSCLYQVKSQLPFDFSLTSHSDERLCAAQHLSVLSPDDVVVYDRGYLSYVMFHQHCDTGIHAVFRLQDKSFNVINKFLAGSQTDVVTELIPSERTCRDIKKQHPKLNIVPLKIRLVKYEIAGKIYSLGTTLLDSERYPLNELMDVYHARWGVEELYKVSKQIFTVGDFHAKTERGVKQELYAHFTLITMNRLFTNQADIDLNADDSSLLPTKHLPNIGSIASNATMRTLQTNFKNCIHVVVRSLEELLLMRDRIANTVRKVFSLVIGRHQRKRPGRSYPRKSMRPKTKWCSTNKKFKKGKVANATT